jgi:MoaA/NifB/PqqE/SkfB family radical SAM enzyme
MKAGVVAGWGRILQGYRPNLSIEITRECPLRCPGCYAYGADHLGGDVVLRELADLKGDALVDGVLQVVADYKPIHLSIVGGEPLVRFRELGTLLPALTAQGIHTQVVTSAVRPIPTEWAGMERLQICVSIDGLQPEHDARRAPATYDRILKHIKGHQITVHCTVTRQQTEPGYLEKFVEFWVAQPDVKRIWFSLYTPQRGEDSPERLRPVDRARVVTTLTELYRQHPKLHDMRPALLSSYLQPPADPSDCIFAQTTACLSADLKRDITPCQFGGDPDCSQCGCMASAGLEAIGRHRLPGGLKVGSIYWLSRRVGQTVGEIRLETRGSGLGA